METPLISMRKFNKIREHLPTPGSRPRRDDRLVLSGIIFVIRHALAWRHLPEFYGKWTTVYSRFRRWSKLGIFEKIFKFFSNKLKRRWIGMLDTTYAKAHRTASSMSAGEEPRLLGRSCGGITTKIHLVCDSEGLPRDVMITGGQVHDAKVAPEIIERNDMTCLIADKAYHSKRIRKALEEREIIACIPPKSNSKGKIEYDKTLYKSRHTIENMFSRLKDWKGIAFRTNRSGHSYCSFVYIALVAIFY